MRVLTGVDVIVVDHRTPDDLSGFLESFDACRDANDRLHIVLVDPTPASAAVAAAWSSHPAHASTSTYHSNVGYGASANGAALGGTADVVAVFNADTRLTPGVTTACADALRAHDDWGVLGPRQVDDHGLLTHAGIFGTNREPNFRGQWKKRDRGQCDDVRDDAVSVSGSAYFVKRSVWRELTDCPMYRQACRVQGVQGLGPLLESPLWFEDMWCSVHARHHGWKVVFFGTAVMIHRWHKSVEATDHRPATDKYKAARAMYRAFADLHGIDHE